MVTDPIGDMITQIKNASMAGRRTVELPYSKLKQAVASIIRDEGFLESIEKVDEGPHSNLRIKLKFSGRKGVISDLKRKSKPGLRIYVKRDSIPTVIGGMGIAIISTPQGIMTGKEAKKRGLGGELLCEIW